MAIGDILAFGPNDEFRITSDGNLIVTGDATFGGTTTVEELLSEAATELTIASGAITVTQGAHKVDTESDAASDNLDTISGTSAEQFLLLRPASAARTVVLRDFSVGAGNIYTPGQQSLSLAEANDYALCYSDGTSVVVVAYRTQALVDNYRDQFVNATIAVADTAGGGTDAALTVDLKRALDNTTDPATLCQFLIVATAAQYDPVVALVSTVTFSVATVGTIAATGNGWALVTSDATGNFACTASDSADEGIYFRCITAQGGDAVGERCVIVSSNSDLATWSA